MGKPESQIRQVKLGDLAFENPFTNELRGDEELSNTRRQVHNAYYSRVLPTPTAAPATLVVSEEVRSYFSSLKEQRKVNRQAWDQTFAAWQSANPEKAALLQSGISRELPANLMESVQVFAEDAKVATRAAGSQIINDLAQAYPLLISGSADLHGSTKNYIKKRTIHTFAHNVR